MIYYVLKMNAANLTRFYVDIINLNKSLKAYTLLDSGASHLYISRKFCEKHNLDIIETGQNVRILTGLGFRTICPLNYRNPLILYTSISSFFYALSIGICPLIVENEVDTHMLKMMVNAI